MLVLRRQALGDAAAVLLPAAFLAGVLGGGLVQASYMGTKWLALVVLGYLALAAAMVVPDRRLAAVALLSACIPVGFQYNLWTHGRKTAIATHFGGALPEPVLHLVDIPIAILLALWCLDIRLGTRPLPRWTRVDTLVLGFLAASLPSLYATSEYPLFAFEMLRYLKFLAVYWALRTYLDRPAMVWAAVGGNVAVLALQGLVSLMQYFLFFHLPIPVGGVSGTDVEMVGNEMIQRVTGVLGHSNTFAAYLGVVCSWCLVLLFSRLPLAARAAVLPFFGAGLVSLVLTFSRNGWLIFALNALLIAFWSWRTGRLGIPVLSVVALCGLLLVGALASTGVMDAVFTRIFRTDSRNFDSRWDLIVVAMEMIKSHPFTGIGLNAFEESMIRFDPLHITHIIRQPVHNGYLLVAAETGLAALAFAVALLVLLVGDSARAIRSGSEAGWVAGMVGLATFLGIGFGNLFDVTARKEPIVGLMVLVAALVARAAEAGKTPSAPPARPDL